MQVEPRPIGTWGSTGSWDQRASHDQGPGIRHLTAPDLRAARVAHFDETGLRLAGKLARVHSSSSGKYVLVTVRARRGTEVVDTAGVLPAFAGTACRDAWAPYDCSGDVAGQAARAVT